MSERDASPASSARATRGAEFAAMQTKYLDATAQLQREMLDAMGEINRDWINRATSQIAANFDVAVKLSASTSWPQASMAHQQWLSQRTQTFAEDGLRMLSNGQKLIERTARVLGNGQGIGGT